MNAGGIVLKDDAVVPTYDWVVSPIKPAPQQVVTVPRCVVGRFGHNCSLAESLENHHR
jgi:hypothetical protein